METADIAVVSSQIIALAAVVATVLTCYINAKNEYKIKKFERLFDAKTKAYQEFLSVVTGFDQNSKIAYSDLWAKASVVLLYCSEDVRNAITEFSVAVATDDGSENAKNTLPHAYEEAVLAMQKDLFEFLDIKESLYRRKDK